MQHHHIRSLAAHLVIQIHIVAVQNHEYILSRARAFMT